MKKQIIAAAVAASLSAVALADVSISGAAQVNITKKDGTTKAEVSHDVDLKVVGKTGETSFVVDLENTSLTNTLTDGTTAKGDALQVKNAYMTTNFGGLNLKVGEYFNGDSNLNNATQQAPRAEVSTGVGAVGVKYVMEPSNQHHEMHLSADLAGVKVNYEQENTDNHKIISVAGSLGGVNFQYVDSRSDNATGVLNAAGVTGGGTGANAEVTSNDALIVGHQYKVTAAGSTPATEAELLALSQTGATEADGTTSMTASGNLAAGMLFTPTVTTKIKASTNTELDDLNTVKALGGLDGNDERTYIISTNLGGVKIEYQKMESKTGTTSDGFFGTFAEANLLEADGFGLTTSLAGNTVQIRNYKTVTEVDGVSGGTHTDQSTAAGATELDSSAATSKKRDTKIIVTRPLASGATAEFTYVTGDSTNSMDLEFRMKF